MHAVSVLWAAYGIVMGMSPDWCSLLAASLVTRWQSCCLTCGKSPLSEVLDLHHLVWLHVIIVCMGVTNY